MFAYDESLDDWAWLFFVLGLAIERRGNSWFTWMVEPKRAVVP